MVDAAVQAELNVRKLDDSHITVSFDETTTLADVDALFKVLNKGQQPQFSAESLASEVGCLCKGNLVCRGLDPSRVSASGIMSLRQLCCQIIRAPGSHDVSNLQKHR